MHHLDLPYAEAKKHYPDETKAALKSMAAKFKRAGSDAPAPEDMTWMIFWASGHPVSRPPLVDVTSKLSCRHGRRQTIIAFPDPASEEEAHAQLPYHVSAFYRNAVDPDRIPNAGVFRIKNPNGSVSNAIATGGYSDDGKIAIHYLIVGDPWLDGMHEEDLIEIRGQRAVFEGGLKDLARERYDAAGEGGEFTFGSKVMRRLTRAEISPYIAGQTFRWSLF